MTSDYAVYIAGLPKVLAGAGLLCRDAGGRVLLAETTYREDGKWVLPGGTVESDAGETPRQAARREGLEEIGLDIAPGALLAVDWVPGANRPPIVAFLYDGGVLDDAALGAIRLQEEELSAWRLVPVDEIGEFVTDDMNRRIHAGLTALGTGTGPAELVDGRVPGQRPTA